MIPLDPASLTSPDPRRPYVILKAATTADGRIASAFGESQWITGPEARAAGHHIRAAVDAILVGSGTLLADDPSLSTRVPGGSNARPVLLDSRLRCPADARVLTAGLRPLLFCAPDAPARSLPADIIRVPRAGGGLSVPAVLAVMVDRGLRSVLVEGGGLVHRAMLDAGVVDQIDLFVAPKVLAGGPGWVGGTPLHLDEARFVVEAVAVVGADVQIRMRAAR